MEHVEHQQYDTINFLSFAEVSFYEHIECLCGKHLSFVEHIFMVVCYKFIHNLEAAIKGKKGCS